VHTGPIEGSAAFDTFVGSTGETVRRALVGFYGVEIGSEAAADAMTVAWERWSEVSSMENPAGFLFRVGQSKARPHLRWRNRRAAFPLADTHMARPAADVVDLLAALGHLRPEQRAAVLMVKSYGFSYREAGDVLGVSEAAITNHVHRALELLRLTMKEDA
jgi:RNA polymerase sigma-70 factor (ECF subfamily)